MKCQVQKEAETTVNQEFVNLIYKTLHHVPKCWYPGCIPSGISEPIKTQTYRLNLKTTPQAQPLFKGILEGLVDADGNELEQHPVTLPDWLRPEKIHYHFNGKPIDFDA